MNYVAQFIAAGLTDIRYIFHFTSKMAFFFRKCNGNAFKWIHNNDCIICVCNTIWLDCGYNKLTWNSYIHGGNSLNAVSEKRNEGKKNKSPKRDNRTERNNYSMAGIWWGSKMLVVEMYAAKCN